MFQTKVVEEIKTHLMFNKFSPKIVPFMRLCGGGNIVEPDRPQMKIQYGAEKLQDYINSQYLIFIAFLQQQLLREHVSTLRFTHIAILVNT
jgi:hypothetical protein